MHTPLGGFLFVIAEVALGIGLLLAAGLVLVKFTDGWAALTRWLYVRDARKRQAP